MPSLKERLKEKAKQFAKDTLATAKHLTVSDKDHRKVKSLYGMDPRTQKAALFASGSYNTDTVKSILGYKLDQALSTQEDQVWVKSGSNKIWITSRGTAAKKDILSDIQIMRGKMTGRTTQLVKFTEKVIAKYGKGKSLRYSSHSLGGNSVIRSAAIMRRKGVEIKTYAFNAGYSPKDRNNPEIKREINASNVHFVTVEGDAVSVAGLALVDKDNQRLTVIAKNKGQSTLSAHKMDNFKRNEDLASLHKHFKTHGLNQDVVHALHHKVREGRISESKLKQKVATAKQQLGSEDKKGSGYNAAINRGDFLGSGGFHAVYTPVVGDFTNGITIDGRTVPAPGLRVYKNGDFLWSYNADTGKPFVYTGDMAHRAQQALSAKGYGQGPAILINQSSGFPATQAVAFTPALGGQGWDVVPASSKDEWKSVLQGYNRQNTLAWADVYHPKDGKGRVLGQASVNPFLLKPHSTIEDTEANVGLTIAEFLGQNSVQILMTAAESIPGVGPVIAGINAASTVLDVASEGLHAAGVKGELSPLTALQNEINKHINPSVRMQNLNTIDDVFDTSKMRTHGGAVAFSNTNQDIIRDERVINLVSKLQTLTEATFKRVRKKDLTKDEMRDLIANNPMIPYLDDDPALLEHNQMWKFNIIKNHYARKFFEFNRDRSTDKKTVQDMLKMEARLNHINKAADQLDKMEKLNDTARKLGVPIDEKHLKLARQLLVPKTTEQDMTQKDLQMKQLTEGTEKHLDDQIAIVRQKAADMVQNRYDQSVGDDKDSQDMAAKMADRKMFQRKTGKTPEEDPALFKQFSKEYYQAYLTATGRKVGSIKTSHPKGKLMSKFLREEKVKFKGNKQHQEQRKRLWGNIDTVMSGESPRKKTPQKKLVELNELSHADLWDQSQIEKGYSDRHIEAPTKVRVTGTKGWHLKLTITDHQLAHGTGKRNP